MTKSSHDRRREARALTAALIEIVDEYNDSSTCVLEDLSSSGASLHSDIALRVGAPVTVKVGAVVQVGTVRHCQPIADAFSVGIEFSGGRWPEPVEFPIHWIHADQN